MFSDAILTVMVSDMDRARAFYTDVLGCELVESYGDEWSEVRAGTLRIGLHPGGKKPFNPHPRHMSVGLRVDDLDAVMAQLGARG